MNIFLAVTVYDDKIHAKNSISILKNCIDLMQKKHKVIPYFNSDLYIDRSRNFCVKLFLESDCTDMLFIDADLEFETGAIDKIMKHDKELVAGSYRYKKQHHDYPVVIDWSNNNNCKEEETGLVHVLSAPTGFMRINRSVFEKMIKHYDVQKDENNVYQFFETGTRVFNDGLWWGEDTAFCKKWREMGGKVFVEPNIDFTHIGSEEYKGNYHKWLLGRSVTEMDKVDSGIKGWMTESELQTLGELASKADSIVEIGCWKGRSTKQLLEHCKGTVTAVDHFNGTPTDTSEFVALGLNVYDEFMKNVGHYPNLKVLKGDSLNIANSINGDRFDLVFIDAGHTYEECKADILAWLPKCVKVIAGHDYSDSFPGVKDAVNEIFGEVNVKDSIWWIEL